MVRRVITIEKDQPTQRGEPMVIARLECDHVVRCKRDNAPMVGDLHECHRCRTNRARKENDNA